MRLYLLRHGIAANRTSWPGDDADRPLTTPGRRRVEQVSNTIERLELELCRIVTSPYLRAQQSAEIVATRLGMASRLEVDSRLAPGFDLAKLAALLHTRAADTALLLVGHEPDFSDTIADMTGGGQLRFKKAGLARVDLVSNRPLRGELVWFIPPKLLLGLVE